MQQRNTYVDCLHQCYNLTIFICSKFAETIPRPFTIHYDPYTQSVEVVNSKERMLALASDIKYSISTLEDAIKSTALVPKGDVEVRPFALWLYIMYNSWQAGMCLNSVDFCFCMHAGHKCCYRNSSTGSSFQKTNICNSSRTGGASWCMVIN